MKEPLGLKELLVRNPAVEYCFIPDPNNWPNENAVAPAAPRAIWVGMRVRWD
jgi:hypothetical protein